MLRLGKLGAVFLLGYPFATLKLAQAQEGDRMQVSLERSGGFANIPFSVTIDTDTLSRDEVAQLRQWIAEAQFFELPSSLRSPRQSDRFVPPSADRFQYEITVQEGDRSHTVIVNEAAIPEALKPLVQWLTAHRTRG